MQDYYIVLQAVSIIRTKPQHMSGKVYAQVLNTKLTGSEKHWRSKVFVLRLNESLEAAAACIRFLWPGGLVGEINIINCEMFQPYDLLKGSKVLH